MDSLEVRYPNCAYATHVPLDMVVDAARGPAIIQHGRCGQEFRLRLRVEAMELQR